MKLISPGRSLIKKLLIPAVFFILLQNVSGQERLPDRKISLHLNEKRIEFVLKAIENISGVLFSYNSDILPDNSPVTIHVDEEPIEKVLSGILGKSFHLVSTGSYIIILEKKNQPEVNPERRRLNISGSVVDARTLMPISAATIYDMGSLVSSQSDSLGRFEMSLTPKTNFIAIRCSKSGYSDSVIMIDQNFGESIHFRVKPLLAHLNGLDNLTAKEIHTENPAGLKVIKTIIAEELLLNSRNVIIYDKRIAQLSFVPKIGTNLRMSGAVINHFSINLLGGFSKGVSGFEAAGIANINKSDVNGVQLSVLINLSGGNVNGFQASGVLNLIDGHVRGCQITVGTNVVKDSFNGVQIAGVANICNEELRGLQLSPLFNISKGGTTGAQVAGLMNMAKQPKFQFGLINYADTSSGVPLGIFNIIKHGYYTLSVSADELQTGYFLFRMGTKKMYSTIGLSASNPANSSAWGFNYGFGTHLFHEKRIGLNIELLSSVISAFGSFDHRTISRLSLTSRLQFRFNNNYYLFAGPSVNLFISDTQSTDVSEFISNTLPARNWNYTSDNTRFDGWIGGNFGLKYRF
jgi:hypothetical protein